MKSAHRYQRRTLDETKSLALTAVREQILASLPPEAIEEMKSCAAESEGDVGPGWEPVTGFEPDRRMHYEFQVYKPSEQRPYVEKIYVRVLASRDRSDDRVWIMWQPPLPAPDRVLHHGLAKRS